MPHLIFKIAPPEKIAEFIFDLRDSLEEGALKDRKGYSCIFVPLTKSLKQELIRRKSLTKSLKNKLKKISEIFIRKKKNEIKLFLEEVKKYWNKEVEEIYFKEIEKIIQYKLRKRYICYITNAVVGAYFNKNIVTLDYYKKINMTNATFVIAEELLHLIYWEKWKKVFNKRVTEKIYEGKKWCAWHISEVIPEYILTENPSFKKFDWYKIKREKGYPWIPKVRKILDPIWKRNKNFDSFIMEAHKTCKCFAKKK